MECGFRRQDDICQAPPSLPHSPFFLWRWVLLTVRYECVCKHKDDTRLDFVSDNCEGKSLMLHNSYNDRKFLVQCIHYHVMYDWIASQWQYFKEGDFVIMCNRTCGFEAKNWKRFFLSVRHPWIILLNITVESPLTIILPLLVRIINTYSFSNVFYSNLVKSKLTSRLQKRS